MTGLMIEQFTCRQDNFGVLVHDPMTGETASIDAPDARVIEDRLAQCGWNLTHIFVTHHHGDHVEGIAALKHAHHARVIGPAAEAAKIADLDETCGDGDTFEFAGRQVRVISTPGHTLGHICFYIADDRLLFAGDTLFALGCGRLFEGTAADMSGSLQKLAALPDDTTTYCGHEYTLSNARFAVSVDPDNQALAERLDHIVELRGKGIATLPTAIGYEKRTNPFLRAGDPGIRRQLGMESASDQEVFAELRRRKDSF
ncbi:hydroxyacylglutathione hydrolase [Hoeflea marina]|uniref:Hydroxyacylglutathione hydrolase n=1 Tax=Hoeflea marina TaxID=274592 RepID=A0A317PEI8_9HYPH|nr:hydroxyacylglutathione hydrolase [Hoeflea marina]PWV98108.1 hydroxyacylglutathione hydrolase [Hoeflea marina]